MRVCPNCGHIDPPQWKHSRYSYWIDACKLEDFNELNPEMVKGLLQGAILEDEHYLYRLTKNKHRVERKAKVDYGNQWNIPMESTKKKGCHHDTDFRKVWFKVTPNQRRLLEEPKP